MIMLNVTSNIGVTSLIDKYCQPFDSEFWSSYKALEKCIPPESWKLEKKALLANRHWNPSLLSLYQVDPQVFASYKEEVLKTWDQANKESREQGIKLHKEIEDQFYKSGNKSDVSKFGVGGVFICKPGYTELDLNYGVYPEYKISVIHDNITLSGQIDLLIKNENDLILIDHKTSSKLEDKGFFDPKTKQTTKMLYPLTTVEDCNIGHYTMQLSTYAWMLQQINPKFQIKDLIINHYDRDGNNKLHHVPYMKHEVELMLSHYKKQLLKQQRLQKYKPIEY